MPSNTNGVNPTPQFLHPVDFCETLLDKNCALRAYGELLATAPLSNFDPAEYQGPYRGNVEKLQRGLQMLLELFIADQEQAIVRFQLEYVESDEHLLRSAAQTLNLAKQGIWTTGHMPAEQFDKAIARLQTIIDRGDVLKSVAVEMVETLHQYAPPTSRKAGKGVA